MDYPLTVQLMKLYTGAYSREISLWAMHLNWPHNRYMCHIKYANNYAFILLTNLPKTFSKYIH